MEHLVSLSLPKVNLLSWSGKWSAQQDKNLGRFPNSGAEFYYSNTCKELRCLTALYVPVKLHDSSPNFILQSWKLRKYVSFSVLLFFFFFFCFLLWRSQFIVGAIDFHYSHSCRWRNKYFRLLYQDSGKKRELFCGAREQFLWTFLQQLLHIFKLPIRHSTNISFQMHATY